MNCFLCQNTQEAEENSAEHQILQKSQYTKLVSTAKNTTLTNIMLYIDYTSMPKAFGFTWPD